MESEVVRLLDYSIIYQLCFFFVLFGNMAVSSTIAWACLWDLLLYCSPSLSQSNWPTRPRPNNYFHSWSSYNATWGLVGHLKLAKLVYKLSLATSCHWQGALFAPALWYDSITHSATTTHLIYKPILALFLPLRF